MHRDRHGMPCLPCLACGKTLKNVVGDANNQPSMGLAFQTYGHYGTTVFDPLDSSYLEINICDECMLKAESHNRVYIGRHAIAPAPLELWDWRKYSDQDDEYGGEG